QQGAYGRGCGGLRQVVERDPGLHGPSLSNVGRGFQEPGRDVQAEMGEGMNDGSHAAIIVHDNSACLTIRRHFFERVVAWQAPQPAPYASLRLLLQKQMAVAV